MEIVRTSAFEKTAKKLGATPVELAVLETLLARNPDAGDVIKGLGGVRKVRFAMKGRGKSGGGRAVYLVLRSEEAVYLLLAYDKTVQADLSQAQRKAVLALVEELS